MNANFVARPQQERFDMTYEESYAFWLMIVKEYSVMEIRRDSLLLVNNERVETP